MRAVRKHRPSSQGNIAATAVCCTSLMAKGPTNGEILEALIDFRDAVGLRFDAVDKKLEEHDRRFDEHDRRFDNLERRIGHIETRIEDMERRLPA